MNPKYLHPTTANKTNLKVAKVLTIIDPRKPLPEAVNVQFDSEEICRVLVSSLWMPPVCGHCKEIGHSTKRCRQAPKICQVCKSINHGSGKCPRERSVDGKGKKTRRNRSKSKEMIWSEVSTLSKAPQAASTIKVTTNKEVKLSNTNDFTTGETSEPQINHHEKLVKQPVVVVPGSDSSEVEEDSSDIDSTDSDEEEGQIVEDRKVIVRQSRKQKSGTVGTRGRSPTTI